MKTGIELNLSFAASLTKINLIRRIEIKKGESYSPLPNFLLCIWSLELTWGFWDGEKSRVKVYLSLRTCTSTDESCWLIPDASKQWAFLSALTFNFFSVENKFPKSEIYFWARVSSLCCKKKHSEERHCTADPFIPFPSIVLFTVQFKIRMHHTYWFPFQTKCMRTEEEGNWESSLLLFSSSSLQWRIWFAMFSF